MLYHLGMMLDSLFMVLQHFCDDFDILGRVGIVAHRVQVVSVPSESPLLHQTEFGLLAGLSLSLLNDLMVAKDIVAVADGSFLEGSVLLRVKLAGSRDAAE